jgi:hypothetical protein
MANWSTKLRLTDQFKQNWHSTLQISPKSLSYSLIKLNFRFEKYLDVLNDKNRFTFCRFRTSNHRLPIEVGHWANVERHNRLCQLCQSREIGDEFHYVLGTDHLTWTGGLWFFVSFRIFFSDTTRVRIFIFFVVRSANFFSPEFNIGIYDKNCHHYLANWNLKLLANYVSLLI